jgi:hypothetical protein
VSAVSAYFNDGDPIFGASKLPRGSVGAAVDLTTSQLPSHIPGNDAARKVILNAEQRFAEIASLYKDKLVTTTLKTKLTGDFTSDLRAVNELRDDSIDLTSEKLKRILDKAKKQNPLLNSIDIDRFIALHEQIAINVSELMVKDKPPYAHLRKDGKRHVIAHPLDVMLLCVEAAIPNCQSVEQLEAVMMVSTLHDSMEDCKKGHEFAERRISNVLAENDITPVLAESVLKQVQILTIKHGKSSNASVDTQTQTFDPNPWVRKIAGYEYLLRGNHEVVNEYIQSLRIKGADCLVNSIDLIERLTAADKADKPELVRQILAASQGYEFLCQGLLEKGHSFLAESYQVAKHALEMNQCILALYPDTAPLIIIQ